jgi:hypothetical protein
VFSKLLPSPFNELFRAKKFREEFFIQIIGASEGYNDMQKKKKQTQNPL